MRHGAIARMDLRPRWLDLENTQTQMTNTLQQLSSGYRINTAANDPAGLAISQQMQSQIAGLKQAYSNAQSGVSLLQTADGALGQIQNILQSMRSLASEAATSTMNSSDTANLQTEMNQYAKEITQITNTTQFNNINLLGGAFGTANNPEQIQIGANQGQTLGITLGAADAYTLGITAQSATVSNSGQGVIDSGQAITVAGATPGDTYSLGASVTPWSVTVSNDTTGIFSFTNQIKNIGAVTLTHAVSATVRVLRSGNTTTLGKIAVTVNGTTTDYTASAPGPVVPFAGVNIGGSTFQIGMVTSPVGASAVLTFHPTKTTFTLSDTTSGGSASATTAGAISTGQQQSVSMNGGSTSVTFSANATLAAETSANYLTAITEVGLPTGTGVSRPPVPTVNALSPATLSVATTGNAATGANGVLTTQASAGAGAINIESVSNAQAALSAIDNAINTLSTERANVGAYQNRLNFASSNDQTAQQNLTSARAGIVDANMALQMAKLSKEQVLQQSGVAMLAQANQVPQPLLKLLP